MLGLCHFACPQHHVVPAIGPKLVHASGGGRRGELCFVTARTQTGQGHHWSWSASSWAASNSHQPLPADQVPITGAWSVPPRLPTTSRCAIRLDRSSCMRAAGAGEVDRGCTVALQPWASRRRVGRGLPQFRQRTVSVTPPARLPAGSEERWARASGPEARYPSLSRASQSRV